MSSYFDDLDRQVRELGKQFAREENFVEAVAELEDQVIKTVSLAIGDREFPDDLRHKILRIMTVSKLRGIPGVDRDGYRASARSWLIALCKSGMFAQLHSAFHEVAGRRTETRFGLLLDNPEGIVKRRDAHDRG